MNTIKIQADGSAVERDRKLDADPLEYLGYRVELAEDTTLRSFFK